MNFGGQKEKKTIVELLESDELLADIAPSSTISALVYRINVSPIVREIYQRIESNPENIKIIEDHLDEAIKLKVDNAYLHPKTFEICVCVVLLGSCGPQRTKRLIKRLARDDAPKFFFCSKLARDVISRMEAGVIRDKSQLIEEMASAANISKNQAAKALDSGLESITKALRKGEKVTLVGFGTFSVMYRKARTGINPRTGAPMKIGAKKVPKFIPGKKLKEAAASSKKVD